MLWKRKIVFSNGLWLSKIITLTGRLHDHQLMVNPRCTQLYSCRLFVPYWFVWGCFCPTDILLVYFLLILCSYGMCACTCSNLFVCFPFYNSVLLIACFCFPDYILLSNMRERERTKQGLQFAVGMCGITEENWGRRRKDSQNVMFEFSFPLKTKEMIIHLKWSV